MFFIGNSQKKAYLCAMHLNAITRKSTLMAVILLVAILFATVLRYWHAPFEMELADSVSHESLLLVALAMIVYFSNGLLQGRVLRRAGLSGGPCAFPMPIYGVLACGIFVAPDMLAASFASLCFILALYLLLSSIHNVEEKDRLHIAWNNSSAISAMHSLGCSGTYRGLGARFVATTGVDYAV